MPLYSITPAALPVTAAAPPAVHTFDSLLDDPCTRQASSGAFLTYTSRGPAVAFPINAPGLGSAVHRGHLSPDFALPTPAGEQMTTTVDFVSVLPSTAPTVGSLPTLADSMFITFTTTTTATTATATTVDSVSGKLAPGLQVLGLAPRPPGVAICPDGQALPVPAAAPPAAQPFMATTPATDQQPGSVTTVTTAASTPTATVPVAPAVFSTSTMTSSVVATTSTTTVAAATAHPTSAVASFTVTATPSSTSTVASSSNSNGVAVADSSGLNPPGSSYVVSTQSVTPSVVCTVRTL